MQNFLDYINEAVQDLDSLLATRAIDMLTPMNTISLTLDQINKSEKK